MKKITTYPEMNAKIVCNLRHYGGNCELYAAQLIEELQAENAKLKNNYLELEAADDEIIDKLKTEHTKDHENQIQEYSELKDKYNKLFDENTELKTKLEKAQTTLFVVVRNSILEKREERGIPENMVDVIAVRTIQKMEDMIDYPSATKARLEAEKALKEKGE